MFERVQRTKRPSHSHTKTLAECTASRFIVSNIPFAIRHENTLIFFTFENFCSTPFDGISYKCKWNKFLFFSSAGKTPIRALDEKCREKKTTSFNFIFRFPCNYWEMIEFRSTCSQPVTHTPVHYVWIRLCSVHVHFYIRNVMPHCHPITNSQVADYIEIVRVHEGKVKKKKKCENFVCISWLHSCAIGK